jgi:predicted MPP superfamily phosphohydrolase
MKHRASYRLAGLAIVGILALLTYSTLMEPYRLEVVRHDMRKADASETLRLVQVSDLHLRDFGKHEQTLVEQIKALDADVVVLSGDAVDREEAMPWLRAFVKALGDTPVLHVPGNWEHWSRLSAESLTSTGARLLLNEKWILQKGKRRLEVVGLDDYTAGQPDLDLLDRNDVSPSTPIAVVVQHSPAFFDQASVGQRMGSTRFDLCLAGHTHGGQVALFGWAPWKPPGSSYFTAGFYDVPGCRLYVSRGLGTSILPVRFGSIPELVVFDF